MKVVLNGAVELNVEHLNYGFVSEFELDQKMDMDLKVNGDFEVAVAELLPLVGQSVTSIALFNDHGEKIGEYKDQNLYINHMSDRVYYDEGDVELHRTIACNLSTKH